MTNLKSLKINSLLIYLIALLCNSCNQKINTLQSVSIITNKKILIDDTKINSSSTVKFNDDTYPLEKDIYLDDKGKILKIGKSKGEGLLFYYRKPKKLQLSLNDDQEKFQLKLDKTNHLIIENNDTIKSFIVDIKDQIIYFNDKKRKRIFLYSYE